ncbi:hypothetical protein [Microbacterium sp.]|uniref:hypothetical protein n=1 Tax=Microbacterium sp. TaxID=51671 RepID=UPI0039E25072
MKARIAVGLIAILLVVYLVLVGQRAWLMLGSRDAVGMAMGAALIVLPVLAAWSLWRELMFGIRSTALVRRLEREGRLPAEAVSLTPSGRPRRDEVDALFPAYRAAVEAAPEDWRAWLRLGLVYDGAGDRRRARAAVRRAIALDLAARR